MNLHKLLSFEQGRIKFFETLTKYPENWQQNPTPLDIVRKMVDKTSLDDKKILVLFNIEFLQVLVEERKINPKNIYYIADNDLEYLSGIKIFKVQSYQVREYTVPALKKLIEGLEMKFDLVFSNPPYNKNVDIKILTDVYDVADEFVIVHPSGWLIDLKDKTPLYQTFKKKIDGVMPSVEFFNGNLVFGLDIFIPCVITHINKKHKGNISINSYDKFYSTDDINKITKYDNKWDLVKSFKDKISSYITNNDGNIWQRFTKFNNNSINKESGYLFQIPMGRGNCDKTSKIKTIKDDFYGVFSNDQKEVDSKNTSDNVSFSRGSYCYFTTELERHNFINYLKTDFARFCLSIYKIRKDYDAGEMELIPWLDFTEEWDDEKLFKKFDVSQELQDYIREFLPDYYGIRK